MRPVRTPDGRDANGQPKFRHYYKLYTDDHPKGRLYTAAELVLEAFVGPRPPDGVACHWDDNAEDNSIGNLRWGTRAENCRDEKFNRSPETIRFASGMSIMFRCSRTGELVLDVTPLGNDGCSCDVQDHEPDTCLDCLKAAIGEGAAATA
jgi:hypothetical protein